MTAATRGRLSPKADEPRSGGLFLARLAAGGALLGGAFLVLRPFLVPLVWAAITAYMTWPLYRRARDRWQRPALTAALFVAAAFLALIVPVAWLMAALAEQVPQLVRGAQGWLEAGAPLPGWLSDLPLLGAQIEAARDRALAASDELGAYLRGHAGALSQYAVGLAGGLARNVFVAAIALLAIYTFYVDGERIAARARGLASALFPDTALHLLDHVGAVVQAVVFGLVGTAIVQGLMAGLGLALFGVPSPVALGAATTVLSFVPVGPPVVWGGASLWLYASGHTAAAIGMAVWGVLLVSSVDNVLRPVLIRRAGTVELPFLLVLFGVLGGLAAFGFLGLFLGPVLLSVTFALRADCPAPRRAAKAAAKPRRN